MKGVQKFLKSINWGNAIVFFHGIVETMGGDKKTHYVVCGEAWKPWLSHDEALRPFNTVSVEGEMGEGFEIEVFAGNFQKRFSDGKIGPFISDGLKRFSSDRVLYVELKNKHKRGRFMLSNNRAPSGKITFDLCQEFLKEAQQSEKPETQAEKPVEKPKEKPLTMKLEIPGPVKENGGSRKQCRTSHKQDPDKPKTRKPESPRSKVQVQGMSTKEAAEAHA